MSDSHWFYMWAPLVARILVGGTFLMAGIQRVIDFEGTVGFITSAGLPAATALAVVGILIEIIGGLSVLLGYKIQYGAGALAIFVIVVNATLHTDLSDTIQMTIFTKNAAILGGLLYMTVCGAGSFSIDDKKARHETSETTL